MLVVGEACLAQIVVLTSVAVQEVTLGVLLNAAIAGASKTSIPARHLLGRPDGKFRVPVGNCRGRLLSRLGFGIRLLLAAGGAAAASGRDLGGAVRYQTVFDGSLDQPVSVVVACNAAVDTIHAKVEIPVIT